MGRNLKISGSGTAGINGYGLTDEDGNWYRFPDALPAVPPGAFVLLILDGTGSGGDDYNFSDNLATLHSQPGMVNILEGEADQVALYTSPPLQQLYLPLVMKTDPGSSQPLPITDTVNSIFLTTEIASNNEIVSFVAWGRDPGGDARNTIGAGLWVASGAVNTAPDTGIIDESSLVDPGSSIGLLPDHTTAFPEDWGLFAPPETSPEVEIRFQ